MTLDGAMGVRERLGQCLAALLEDGRRLPDASLPQELRAAAMLLTDEEVALSAEALLGVSLQSSMLQPVDGPSRALLPAYRLLGALLSGLDVRRGIAAAGGMLAAVDKLLAAAGSPGDRVEHVLVGLLGSLDAGAPEALADWLCLQLAHLPQEGLARLSASSLPWLVNRLPLMSVPLQKAVFQATLARLKTLPDTDRVPMWLALAAPSAAQARRSLLEATADGGARVIPRALIEDENLPVAPAIRQLERRLNLLFAANMPASREDADKQAALRQISSHLSAADVELGVEVLAGKAAFMLGALISGRSAQEAALLARFFADQGENSILRAVLEGLGDAPLEVYEAFAQALTGTPEAGGLQLAPQTPQAVRSHVERLLQQRMH